MPMKIFLYDTHCKHIAAYLSHRSNRINVPSSHIKYSVLSEVITDAFTFAGINFAECPLPVIYCKEDVCLLYAPNSEAITRRQSWTWVTLHDWRLRDIDQYILSWATSFIKHALIFQMGYKLPTQKMKASFSLRKCMSQEYAISQMIDMAHFVLASAVHRESRPVPP